MDQPAVDSLVASSEPAIRFLARRDLLGQRARDDERGILDGQLVRALFDGQQPDGGFGGHPYRKWVGAHWRLVSLVELGIPAGEPRALAALETVLGWLTSPGHLRGVRVIEGRARRCASQEGNALAVASRLGVAQDERAQLLARSLIGWQWPDGGWNCDKRPEARRSSFHETLPAMWGLHEYATATGDTDAADAARRAADLLLEHRLFRSLTTGEPFSSTVLTFHYPPYWHYDVLQAALVVTRMGLARDPRVDEAAGHFQASRNAEGTWSAGRRWWSPPGARRAGVEVTDWTPWTDQMVTLNVLRVFAARNELAIR